MKETTSSSLAPAKRLVDSHSTGSTLLQGNLATYDTNLSPAVSELEGGIISTDYTDLYMKFDHNVSTGSQTSLNSAKALIDEEDVYLELEIDKLIGAGNFGKMYFVQTLAYVNFSEIFGGISGVRVCI